MHFSKTAKLTKKGGWSNQFFNAQEQIKKKRKRNANLWKWTVSFSLGCTLQGMKLTQVYKTFSLPLGHFKLYLSCYLGHWLWVLTYPGTHTHSVSHLFTMFSLQNLRKKSLQRQKYQSFYISFSSLTIPPYRLINIVQS